MVETDVIPPDHTPGMLHFDTKLVHDDKGFCIDIVDLIVRGKIHLGDHYGKNQQILTRANEDTTRNNVVLLSVEQLLLEASFRKGGKVVPMEGHDGVLYKTSLRMQKFYLPCKRSLFYRPDMFL